MNKSEQIFCNIDEYIKNFNAGSLTINEAFLCD